MEIQKKKNRKRKRRPLLKFVLFVIIVIALLLPIVLSPLCNISKIEVVGNTHYKSNDIIDATDLSIGENSIKALAKSVSGLLKLRYNIDEENIIEKLPYVKKAVVRYVIPDKVRISIEERKPMYLILHQGIYLIMDKDEYIIDNIKDLDEYTLPIIKGIKINSFEIGQPLKLEDGRIIDRLNLLITAINKSDEDDDFKLRGIIDSIDVGSVNGISLFIDSRIVVNLGDLRDINYRISVLKHILLNNLKSDEKGLLDFTSGEKPVFKKEN